MLHIACLALDPQSGDRLWTSANTFVASANCGRYQGKPVRNCPHSAISVFSFHPLKIITTSEGGLTTTDDPQLAQRMAELRSHGIVREADRFERPAAGPGCMCSSSSSWTSTNASPTFRKR